MHTSGLAAVFSVDKHLVGTAAFGTHLTEWMREANTEEVDLCCISMRSAWR